MNPFRSLPEHERFVYTLQQRFSSIGRSTLIVVRRGAAAARLTGDLEIGDYRLVVREKLSFADEVGRIVSYGYEAWRGSKKLYWYDSQSHPDEPSLASTHPHHKHIPPDIKHHRVPAPELSFTRPNLPFLIEEIERELLKHEG
jgi:hypothetical protein